MGQELRNNHFGKVRVSKLLQFYYPSLDFNSFGINHLFSPTVSLAQVSVYTSWSISDSVCLGLRSFKNFLSTFWLPVWYLSKWNSWSKNVSTSFRWDVPEAKKWRLYLQVGKKLLEVQGLESTPNFWVHRRRETNGQHFM